jgi:hypothetical protein
MTLIRHRSRRLAATAFAALLLAALAPAASPGADTPAYASIGISQRLGFDSCAPSVGQMQAFWNNTPFSNFGLYIGGADLGCSTPSGSYISQLQAMGWQFLPLWVGPQAPCSAEPVRMSGDPNTAYQEGKNEALASYRQMQALGMNTDGTPVIYDMENYDTGNASCLNAVKSFVRGWVEQMHVAPAQKAGVYGSTCGSGLQSLAGISAPPDFIHGASWDGNKNTAAMPCIGAGNWTNNQRHKQYAGPHDETWNGVRLNIDSDCSNAPVYPGPDALNTGQGCVQSAPRLAAAQAAPVDAALVTPSFGWVLTGRELLLSTDGGARFTPAALDLAGGTARAAHFSDRQHGWVAVARDGGLSVSRTADGGRTWQTTRIAATDELSGLRIAFGNGARGAIMAQRASSAAFSRATVYVTTDGGASWSARPAPAAGPISVAPDGRLWLAGGVRHDRLFTSTSNGAKWTAARLTVPANTTVTAVTPPTGGALPVTVAQGDTSRVELLGTADGGLSWTPTGRTVPQSASGAGVQPPVAMAGTDLVVAAPTGDRLHRTAPTRAAALVQTRPSGLPTGVGRLTFAGAQTGWALASSGHCATGKRDCSIAYTLVATADGGQTWHPLTEWRTPIA